MANKSKTQKAKASAARQARKAARDNAPEVVEAPAADQAAPSKLKGLFIKSEEPKEETKKAEKAEKTSAKPTKQRFKFLKDVRLELKRVTWPTRQEVIRWTCVVLGALVFFGVFVAVLDAVIQPIVVAISGLGA